MAGLVDVYKKKQDEDNLSVGIGEDIGRAMGDRLLQAISPQGTQFLPRIPAGEPSAEAHPVGAFLNAIGGFEPDSLERPTEKIGYTLGSFLRENALKQAAVNPIAQAGMNVAKSIEIEKQKQKMELGNLQDFITKNPNARLSKISMGGATVDIPLTEEQFGKELERKKKELKVTEETKLETKYKDLIKQYKPIQGDLDSLLKSLNKIPGGRVAGPKAQLGAMFGMPGSEYVLNYQRNSDLILSKIAKTFGGEVGVLTEGDIKRIKRALPALWMNPRERAFAVNWIKQYIQRRIVEFSKGIGGGNQIEERKEENKDFSYLWGGKK